MQLCTPTYKKETRLTFNQSEHQLLSMAFNRVSIINIVLNSWLIIHICSDKITQSNNGCETERKWVTGRQGEDKETGNNGSRKYEIERKFLRQ